MQYQDDVLWADQELELQADETSRKFLHFFQEWFTAADEYVAAVDDSGDPKCSPVRAMRKALTDIETVYGFLAMEWIGQMLLLAFQHWKHGVIMERDLTVIERRSLEVMAAVKAVELADSATL